MNNDHTISMDINNNFGIQHNFEVLQHTLPSFETVLEFCIEIASFKTSEISECAKDFLSRICKELNYQKTLSPSTKSKALPFLAK